MQARRNDEIGILEAIYGVTSNEDDWIRRVCRRVARNLGSDLGVFAMQAWGKDGIAKGFTARRLFLDLPKELCAGEPLGVYRGGDSRLRRHALATTLSGFRETLSLGIPNTKSQSARQRPTKGAYTIPRSGEFSQSRLGLVLGPPKSTTYRIITPKPATLHDVRLALRLPFRRGRVCRNTRTAPQAQSRWRGR